LPSVFNFNPSGPSSPSKHQKTSSRLSIFFSFPLSGGFAGGIRMGRIASPPCFGEGSGGVFGSKGDSRGSSPPPRGGRILLWIWREFLGMGASGDGSFGGSGASEEGSFGTPEILGKNQTYIALF
jgi:hypothetical protein